MVRELVKCYYIKIHKIPYNEVVTINAEYVDTNNNLYGLIYYNSNEQGYLEKYIKLEDVAIKEGYDISSAFKDEKDLYLYSDTKMYAEPAIKYDILIDIPKGTKLHTVYSATDGVWAYVEYNKKRMGLCIG